MNVFPEGTLEAYRASVADGAQFIEVDCYKLPDGTLAIMHDNTLDRTTNKSGATVSIQNLSAWRQVLVLGDKLSPPQAGKSYAAPVFDDVLAEFANRTVIVVEPKNVGAGEMIVRALKKFNVSPDRVLVDSFIESELAPAKSAGYPTCLNLSGVPTEKLPDNFSFDYLGLSEAAPETFIRQAVDARIKVLIYTPNRHYLRDRFLTMGVEGFFTDDAPYLQGSVNPAVRGSTDPYAKQTWFHGQLPTIPGRLGRFTAPAKWGLTEYASGNYYGCLQGWCSPLNRGNGSADFSLELDITFGEALSTDRWAGILLASTDHPLNHDVSPAFALYGYHFLAAKNGRLLVYRYEGGAPELQATADTGRTIVTGETVRYVIKRSGGNVTFSRRDAAATVSFPGANLQALYVTFGAKGLNADFSNVQVVAATDTAVTVPTTPSTTPTPTASTGSGGGGGGAPSLWMLGSLMLIAGLRRAIRPGLKRAV